MALVTLYTVSLTDSSAACWCAYCFPDEEKALGSQLLPQDSGVSEGRAEMWVQMCLTRDTSEREREWDSYRSNVRWCHLSRDLGVGTYLGLAGSGTSRALRKGQRLALKHLENK